MNYLEQLQNNAIHQHLNKRRPSIISFFNEERDEEDVDTTKNKKSFQIFPESKKTINDKCLKQCQQRFTVNKVPEFQIIYEDNAELTKNLETKTDELNPDVENIEEMNQLCINFSKKNLLTDLDDTE
jgi:hypothetical protein